MMDLRDRYRSDKAFKSLVDTMTSFMCRAEFTPSEIRLAAMMASIQYEHMHLRPGFVLRELEEATRLLSGEQDRKNDPNPP